jgi:hypothetical protein
MSKDLRPHDRTSDDDLRTQDTRGGEHVKHPRELTKETTHRREPRPGCLLADLAEAAALQAEVAEHRLALEWGQALLRESVEVWKQIEAHEALAYEDKVTAQVRALQEVSLSLWYLYKRLSGSHRRLKAHRQQLKLMEEGC